MEPSKSSPRAVGNSLHPKTPNTACARSLGEHQSHTCTALRLVQCRCGGGNLRVFKPVLWLRVGSGKMALSRPAYQRVRRAVGLLGNTIAIKQRDAVES